MNKYLLFIIFIIMLFAGCKTAKTVTGPKPLAAGMQTPDPAIQNKVNFSEQSTWLLGYFNVDQLKTPPHSEWFVKGYNEYQYVSEAVNNLLDIEKSTLSIKIVMGTWCPDSRREVPKFMKVLELWKFPADKVQFIGVDNAKQSSVTEYVSLNIQRVPTFIVYKNNIESGRIIENPTTSLEQDILNILKRNE